MAASRKPLPPAERWHLPRKKELAPDSGKEITEEEKPREVQSWPLVLAFAFWINIGGWPLPSAAVGRHM